MNAQDRAVVRAEAGYEVVELRDDIDHANADLVETQVLSLVRSADGVVVDLTAVTFLDSAGLRCLDRLVTAFQRRRLPVRVVAPDGGAVRFTLQLMDFLPTLLATTVDEAIEGLRG